MFCNHGQIIMVRLQRVTFLALHNYLGLTTELFNPVTLLFLYFLKFWIHLNCMFNPQISEGFHLLYRLYLYVLSHRRARPSLWCQWHTFLVRLLHIAVFADSLRTLRIRDLKVQVWSYSIFFTLTIKLYLTIFSLH